MTHCCFVSSQPSLRELLAMKMAFGNLSMLRLAKLEVIMRMILILWSQREDSCLPVSSSLAHLHGDLVLAAKLIKCPMNLFTAHGLVFTISSMVHGLFLLSASQKVPAFTPNIDSTVVSVIIHKESTIPL